jgi:hypothetical protein
VKDAEFNRRDILKKETVTIDILIGQRATRERERERERKYFRKNKIGFNRSALIKSCSARSG